MAKDQVLAVFETKKAIVKVLADCKKQNNVKVLADCKKRNMHVKVFAGCETKKMLVRKLAEYDLNLAGYKLQSAKCHVCGREVYRVPDPAEKKLRKVKY